MANVVWRDVEGLVNSLAKDVERRIKNSEGQFKKVVRKDFRDGLTRRDGEERIQWCNEWLAMYREVNQ